MSILDAFPFHEARVFLEDIVLGGTAFMAVFYGIRRIYRSAKNIDDLLSHAKSEAERSAVLATDLKAHIDGEDARDLIRDQQITTLLADVSDIAREIRPNGGSSMKDVLNNVHTRVHDLEQANKLYHPAK